jgi:hypothetical protein
LKTATRSKATMQLINNTRESHTLLSQDKLVKGLSEQYAPVSTELLLKPFFDNGWEVKRKRSNKRGTKEWLTLNNPNFLFDNGDEFTLDVLNSYNGLSALKIFFGIGRIVCLNGMVVGDMDHFKYVHRGNQIYQNIENDYDKIVAKLLDVKAKIERLKNTFLPPSELHNTINRIASNISHLIFLIEMVKNLRLKLWALIILIETNYLKHIEAMI